MPQPAGVPPLFADPAPLSFAQERLWFLDRLEPGRSTYNLVPVFLRIKGRLDLAALRRALGELARRHESLRTTFPEVDGRPAQVVAPAAPFFLPLVDLRVLRSREAAGRALAHAEAERPYDLARGPLTRGLLFRLEEREHLFLLLQHHIVSDGWSGAVLLRELKILYATFAAGRPSPLPEPPLQPAAHARGQRERLQGRALEEQIAWWRELLEGSPPLLELPIDHPRPVVRRFRGGRVRLSLSRVTVVSLHELARRGVTEFMSLLAAFLVLLHRSTGRADLLVGFPAAGREGLELEGAVGFFVNTLVLRTSVADDPPFLELGQRVREAVLQALQHQDLPFDRLVEELRPERGLSHSPVVQVFFLFEPGGKAESGVPGLLLTRESTGESGTAKFDLTLGVTETPRGTFCSLEYDRDLFDPPTAHRLAFHFQRLLDAAVIRPRLRLSELPLLGEPERHQLLAEWNDTRRGGSGGLVHLLVLERARAAPEAPALSFQGRTVTYGGLAARAAGIARRLRALGAGLESRIGVCMERSPELIAALLGTLMAGAAYVPIDPAQPRERRLALLRECGAMALLTEEGLAGELGKEEEGHKGPKGPKGQEGLQTLLVPYVLNVPYVPFSPDPSPDNLAYVIFTSGSTGKPKGVAVPHRGIVRLVRGADYAAMGPEEVFLQLSPVAFDASTFEIWGCLCNGGRLVIFPPGLPSLAGLAEVVRGEGVTTLWLTAGLFHAMVEEGLEGLTGLRQLLAGGDVLSPAHVRRALAALPGTRLIDGYGPTECTTFACCHPMTALDPPAAGAPVPIGRPIAETLARVVDAHLGEVAIGVPGELLLGGDGLARGYEGDPGMTAERFVPDAVGSAPGARLYRTGDRARWRPDGRLELLGRDDDQVKIRGFRVEPREIEAALAEHPEVGEAAVVVVEGEGTSRRLVGLVAPRPGGRPPAPRELREWLQDRLPHYLVPAALAAVEALPLTANGKVDRRALAALAAAVRPEGRERVAPRTGAERRLAAIWASLLRLDEVGAHDNFFELGGDSLLAIQMVSRAGREGIAVNLRQIFRHQTVAELAAAVEEERAVLGEQGWVTGPVPMTPGQVWFFDRVAGHLSASHQFSTRELYEVRGGLPAEAVARAAAWMLFQHDALRLRVVRNGEAWEQHNAGPEALEDSWTRVDLAALPAPARDGEVLAAARQLRNRGELEGPLARFVLFDLGEERPARLLVILHHLVSDAASWHILREDLETALGQQLRGEEVRLPPKTTSFRAWALRQEELARSEELRGQVDYWLGLARAGARELPADFPGGEAGTGETGMVGVELEAGATRSLLQALPGDSRFTDALFTAVARALLRWTGSSAVLLRQTLHGRDPVFEDVDLSRTLGWISTTAPVLLELLGTEPPAEALAAIAGQIAAVPLRGLGYGLLRYLSGDPEIAARMETVVAGPAATFNFLGRFDGAPATAGVLAEVPLRLDDGGHIPRRDPQLRITAGVAAAADSTARLRLGWQYGKDFYRPETIERLAGYCLEELRRLAG